MKARPILFSGPMVRALLDGRKTQTRRVVKPQPILQDGFWQLYGASWSDGIKSVPAMPGHSLSTRNPYGKPGDLLWVRETWFEYHHPHRAGYAANQPMGRGGKKRPSIFMPRWASRLTLELTDVRVERLQDISEADALAEGIERMRYPERGDWGWPQARYRELWESINGPGSWEANPWVWVLTFCVHKQNIDDFIKSREAA